MSLLTLEKVIEHLESGCHPHEIAIDLRRLLTASKAFGGCDVVRVAEQAALLSKCYRMMETLMGYNPYMSELSCDQTTLGNLRAELYNFSTSQDETPIP